MRALDRKLLRDAVHVRGQLLAISLIIASAVATYVTMHGAYDTLIETRASYYAQYRFPHVFASLKRAPRTVLAAIREIPGVSAVEGRIVSNVTLDVPGLDEPATARLISIPPRTSDMLSLLYLRSGRLPEPGHDAEVVASEQFCKANKLFTGDTLSAVINGRWKSLRVVGIGFSPEYINEISTGASFPDHARFGVLWMNEESLAAAFAMQGAFNDVVLTLSPNADEEAVIARLDPLLDRYGSGGAYGRIDQVSHRFLNEEIAQDRVTATVVPGIFLLVAAFLIHMVLSRLVASQRDQIAILKAFGYTGSPIAMHYLGFALLVVGVGSLAGIPLGVWLGSGLASMYRRFFSFPDLHFRTNSAVLLIAVGASAISASVAAIGAARRAMAVTPAEGMRGEVVPTFVSSRVQRLHRILSSAGRMVLRSIERRPLRASLSVIGIALAVMILIAGRFTFDALDEIMNIHFRRAMRDDTTMVFVEPRRAVVRNDLSRLPGVRSVELFRTVPVRVRFDHRWRRQAMTGMSGSSELRRLIGHDGQQIRVPPHGAVVTKKLAQVLGASRGDLLQIEPMEGRRRPFTIPIVAVTTELIGTTIYVDPAELGRLLGESDVVSGAWLSVEPSSATRLHAALKRLPALSGTSFREAMLASFQKTVAENLRISGGALVFFACLIAFGVVYNNARIALSERGRDLATLRVLGFTIREVGVLLLAEQAVLTAVAIPLGFLMGWGIAQWFVMLFDSENYRLPGTVSPATFAYALIVVTAATALSGAAVWNRVRHLNLIEVLKSRE